MKRLLAKFLPGRTRDTLRAAYRRLRYRWSYCRFYYADYRRYLAHSAAAPGRSANRDQLSAMIFMEAHALEKAFSLPQVRPGFGEQRLQRLVGQLDAYRRAGHPLDALPIRKARSALAAYLAFHAERGFDLGELGEMIGPWADPDDATGGSNALDRDQILRASRGSFADLCSSRWSIRQYTDTPVSDEDLREIVSLARKTPSVCNRQAWRVHFVRDPALKAAVLRLQNGNRGFGDRAACVAIVTTDIQSFVGPTERNEPFVDGGMFAMSLLYAIHYRGIGACPLNWMVSPAADRELHRLAGIPPAEVVIMLVAMGHLPEQVRVARSARHEPEHFYTVT